jgi:mono/diheme cytochrome c family protein
MRALLASVVLIACCDTAFAIEGGDPVAGQAIAANECASCHAIDQFSASPNSAAAPFRTFGAKWPGEGLQKALVEQLSVGHAEMPEYVFEERQIADLIAFLLAIQEKAP